MNNLIIGNFCYGGSSWMAEQFRDTIESMGHTLKTCHEYDNADVKYDFNTIKDFISNCDVIILPARVSQPAKSSNRLILAWSLCKPCIVSPLDSYLKIGIDGENLLIANDFKDFYSCIDRLANDQQLMQKIAINGYKRAMLDDNSYNSVNYAKKYIDEIDKHTKLKPKIHVAIPHYLPRSDYLRLAVDSVLNSADVDVIVSIASSSPNKISFKDSRVRIYQQSENMSFSQATNKAIENRDINTDYILLLNDDTIISKYSLLRMVKASEENNDAIINPLSNCDKGWLHNFDLKIGELRLVPNMSIDAVNDKQIKILQNTQFFDNGAFIESPFAAFYSTLIPICAFNKVGKLSEEYKSGSEDLDWCIRAKRFGYKVGWVANSFCMHFGGKSRKLSHEVRGVDHEKEDKHNNSLINKLWGNDLKKKKVCIWTGPAFEKWDVLSYKRPLPIELGGNGVSGIGGSETSAARLAMEFAKDGCHVLMVGDHPECEQEGVQLVHWTNFKPDEHYFDLFIASRNANCVDERVKAGKVVLWLHDIFALSHREPNNLFSKFHLDKIDYFLALSPWHKNFIMGYHKNIPEEKILIVPNGINTELF